MQQLIDDLLDYLRIGTRGKQLRPTDAGAVARGVIRTMRPSIEESGAEVVCGHLPVVVADETQLRQLLQNLISNAIKFRAEGRTPCIRIGAAARNEMWDILGRDNGIGIEQQYAERIFQMSNDYTIAANTRGAESVWQLRRRSWSGTAARSGSPQSPAAAPRFISHCGPPPEMREHEAD